MDKLNRLRISIGTVYRPDLTKYEATAADAVTGDRVAGAAHVVEQEAVDLALEACGDADRVMSRGELESRVKELEEVAGDDAPPAVIAPKKKKTKKRPAGSAHTIRTMADSAADDTD